MEIVKAGKRWAELHAAWCSADMAARGLERALLKSIRDSLIGSSPPATLQQLEQATRLREIAVAYHYELDAFLRRHFES